MKSIKRHTIIFVILTLSLSIPGYATDYTIGNTGGPNNYDSLEELHLAVTLSENDSTTLAVPNQAMELSVPSLSSSLLETVFIIHFHLSFKT